MIDRIDELLAALDRGGDRRATVEAWLRFPCKPSPDSAPAATPQDAPGAGISLRVPLEAAQAAYTQGIEEGRREVLALVRREVGIALHDGIARELAAPSSPPSPPVSRLAGTFYKTPQNLRRALSSIAALAPWPAQVDRIGPEAWRYLAQTMGDIALIASGMPPRGPQPTPGSSPTLKPGEAP
jgi:hypothetical protein